MNILYLSQFFSFSPTHASAVTTFEIVKRLIQRGHEVTLVVPNLEDSNLRKFSHYSIRVIALTRLRIKEDTPVYGLLCTIWYAPLLVKALRHAHYDQVISMFHPSHLATFSAFILSRLLKIPLIVKVHDILPDMTDPHILKRIYKRVAFKINLGILKKTNMVLVPSNEMKTLAIKIYHVNENNLIQFPNAVDIHKFNPNLKSDYVQRRLRLQNKKILLFTGALSRDRRLESLMRAMPLIMKEEPNVRLLVIGEGSEKLKLLAMSRRCGVDNLVIFMDKIPNDFVVDYISLAKVAIGPLTTLPVTVGTIPIKVLEYMACGKPVVACHGGVSDELIISGYNGVLVEPSNTKELSSAILKLLWDDKLASRIGRNARNHVCRYYNWEVVIGKLEEVLRKFSVD